MLNNNMRKSQKGLAHLTLLFVLAVLLMATTWISRQQVSTNLQASELPQDYYGILRQNNFNNCNSFYHLVNLEEDEVVYCLVIPDSVNLKPENLTEFINQPVKAYGTITEIGGKRYLLIQSIESSTTGFLPNLKNKVLDVLGAFIKRFIR